MEAVDSRALRGAAAPVESRAAAPALPSRDRPQRGIHCLSAASLTLTPQGPRLLADLRRGDAVLTRDQGFRPLLWVGQRVVGLAELSQMPQFAPVLIGQGALGDNLPDRDLLVSPQHRLLICGPEVLSRFGQHEVLVPAIQLVGLPGITRHRPHQPITYVQLVFTEHQVIRCDGTWCESFQPTQASVAGLDPVQRGALLAHLPHPPEEGGYPVARRCLQRAESRLLFPAVPL